MFEVNITLRQDADGWWIAKASTPERGVIVLGPPCGTEEDAAMMARELWETGELVLPVGCQPYANA